MLSAVLQKKKLNEKRAATTLYRLLIATLLSGSLTEYFIEHIEF